MHCKMPSPNVYPLSVFILQKQSVLDRFGHSLVGNCDSKKRSAQEKAQSGTVLAREKLGALETKSSKRNSTRIRTVVDIRICVKQSNILSRYL